MVTAKELGYARGEVTVYEGTMDNPLRYTDVTQQIRAAGQRALTSAEILSKCTDELETFARRHRGKKWDPKIFQFECPWNSNRFSTATTAYVTADVIVLQHDPPLLAALTPDTELINGGLNQNGYLAGDHVALYTDDVLERLKRDNLLNTPLTEDQIAGNNGVHPIWLGLADGDEALIQRLAPLRFKALSDVLNKEKGMGIYLPQNGDGLMRPFVFSDICYDAVADYIYTHPDGGGFAVLSHLVGVAEKKEAATGRTPLETLVGKGTDVGNGIVVVQKDQLSAEAYQALTRKQ